ncbi:MAG: CDP-diacylglycerol--glycerol-3-phosphate 3-phosphatidyltransferase [Candidatus Margulisbacteria bacterium]|nr:CDP-diacylglycerol--glycerol-3-phosphate 3-phosphatidyltransferase [Candidatus Margulisiibacteriota bacterium]
MFDLTLANKITLGRLALIPLAVYFLLTGLLGLAALLFVLLSLTDLIDGYVARKYNQVSELGKMLDPLADKVLVVSLLIGLAALGKTGALPVIIIAAREFLIASIRTHKVFAASPLAKAKTLVQNVAVFMLLFSLPLAELVLWLAVILSLVSGWVYLWQSQFLQQLRSS